MKWSRLAISPRRSARPGREAVWGQWGQWGGWDQCGGGGRAARIGRPGGGDQVAGNARWQVTQYVRPPNLGAWFRQ
jgi:hypothetical protein